MPQQASATLYDADGNEVGVAIAMESEEGVSMNIMADGVLPGSHGAHIHETGTCEPDFMASGEHWGPFDAALGLADDDPSNDSENAVIEVGEDGTGELAYDLGGEVSFAGILDGDGSAFVLHQRNVEPTADTPSGEGDRIACGVFSSGS
jgi:Cu-Zn family superoxide dismutase